MEWQKLSDVYTASNGYHVAALGNTQATEALGRALRNGLSVTGPLNPYPAMARRGLRQILQVTTPDGEIAAAASVELNNGALQVRFLRGENNVEVTEGAAFDAVEGYIGAVNSRKIPLHLDIDGFEFVVKPQSEVVAEAERESKWARAGQLADKEGGGIISRFRAFTSLVLRGDDLNATDSLRPNVAKDAGPGLDAAEGLDDDRVLPALTDAWTTPGGLTVEPISSVKGLQVAGETLESTLMVEYGRTIAISAIESGSAQFAVVYGQRTGPLAIAELRVANGQVLAVSFRGRFEAEPSEEVVEAVQAYVGSVNARLVPTHFPIGGHEFVVSDAVLRTGAFDANHVSLYPHLPAANRTVGDVSYAGGELAPDEDAERDFGEEHDDHEEEELDEVELASRKTWNRLLVVDDTTAGRIKVEEITSGQVALDAFSDSDDVLDDIERAVDGDLALFLVSERHDAIVDAPYQTIGVAAYEVTNGKLGELETFLDFDGFEVEDNRHATAALVNLEDAVANGGRRYEDGVYALSEEAPRPRF